MLGAAEVGGLANIFLSAATQSGFPGVAAMTVQVGTFMWLHTLCNHQWVHGGTLRGTLKYLYGQGGIARLYRGLLPTLALTSLTRFGDIASNAGVLAVFSDLEKTTGWEFPIPVQTAVASASASLWRIALTPLEVVKTNLMVSGSDAVHILKQRVETSGIRVMYYGSFAGVVVGLTAHFPWFYTHNMMDRKLIIPEDPQLRMARNGLIGFCSSSVATCTSNWVRILRANKQANPQVFSYGQAAASILRKEGLRGIFSRGLLTRVVAQSLQGGLFTIVWKRLEEAPAS